MKTFFLSFASLSILAATSSGQRISDGPKVFSSQSLLLSANVIPGLHGKQDGNKNIYLNGKSTVINIEETYKAVFYAGLAKGEYDYVIRAVQQQETTERNHFNHFTKKIMLNY